MDLLRAYPTTTTITLVVLTLIGNFLVKLYRCRRQFKDLVYGVKRRLRRVND